MVVQTLEGMRFLIDPNDPARQPSKVTTYTLSPEEIEAKYGKPVKTDKKYLRAFFTSQESTEKQKVRRERGEWKKK